MFFRITAPDNLSGQPPAPGFRAYISGTLYGIGQGGYGWSSTVSDSYAYYLNFFNDGLYPQGSNYHSYGFPVRCLQE